MTFRCCDVGVFQTYFRTQSHPQVTRLIEVKFKTLIIHCKNQIIWMVQLRIKNRNL
ncbi:hypothetical protein I3843_09G130400 [Carya illinoinensis]|nr:hypothetical protein I3843_09G130400 [Carya illinoinensis]